MDGFCKVEVKEAGPVQLKLYVPGPLPPLTVQVKFNGLPAHTGPELLIAVMPGKEFTTTEVV